MKNIYNPVGFDPRDFLPPHLHKQHDAARYLVHIIECNRAFSKRGRDEWTHLKAEYLLNVMGRHHMVPIREALVNAGVVECDYHPVQGVKSFGFRLGPLFRDSVFKPIPAPPRIRKRAEKHRTTKYPTLPVHRHLYHWLSRLEIDYDAAIHSFASHQEYLDRHLAVELINDGHLIFIPDPYGRVHTQFTFLASALRKFVHFGGERLVSFDICNSQPFFLSLILLKQFSAKSDFGNVYEFVNSPKAKEKRGGRGGREWSPITIELLSLLNSKRLVRLDLPKDVKEYIWLTESGTIYEFCMDLFDISDRNDAKEALFKSVLFNRDFFHKPQKRVGELRARFNDKFPNVYSVVSNLKRKDYRHISHTLQRFESAVVIHRVCERLRVDHPKLPLLTVHDCVYTTPAHQDTLGEVLTREFKQLALTPKFKVADYAQLAA